jgi:phage repressor protein C with HTH and peptisase S24 domain
MKQPDKKDSTARNMAGVAYGELIRSSRRKKGMSQEELGALARVGKNAVGAWEAGRSRPDLSSVPVICETLGIPIHEFFGIQEADSTRQEKQNTDDAVRPFTARFSRLNEYHRQVILREMDVLIDMQEKPAAPVRKLVQIYRNDLAACAGPSWGIGEDYGEPVWLYEDSVTSRADEIIRVSGDSMEPLYHDGDQVLVQHTSSVRPGEIGIFVTGDMGYIKEYRKEGLKSLNPEYPLMRFTDRDEVRCIGRVIGTMRKDMYASTADIEQYTTAETRG